MKIQPILLFFLLSVFFSNVHAQTSFQLTVRVTDPNRAAVPNADVKIHSRDGRVAVGGLTDRDGTYRFEQLIRGEYLLDVVAPGFAGTETQLVRLDQNDVVISVSLPVAGVSEQVVITAQGVAQPVDEVSKSVSVIEERQIDDRDESSVTDALRTLPGLRIQQLGGPGRLVSIKARGLRNQDTAVLIDGLRFRDATTGDATSFLSDFAVTNLDRIEVLRGSGSSLYGTNAIGGVVNIVTDDGGGPTHGQVLLEGGGLGMFRGRAQIGGGSTRWTYSAGVSHLNVWRGIDGDDAARNINGQGRVVLQLTPRSTLSGRLYSGTSFVQLNNNPEAIGFPPPGIIDARPLSLAELRRYESGVSVAQLQLNGATFIPDANDPDNSAANRFFSGAIVFSHRATDNLSFTASYHGVGTRRLNDNGAAGVGFQPFGPTHTRDDGNTQTFNARADMQLGRSNFVTAGYEFERASFLNLSTSFNPADDFSTDVAERSNSFFVQDQVRLLETRLQLSAAFRMEMFSLNQPRFTPVVGAPYAGANFGSPATAYTGDGSIAYMFPGRQTKLRAHIGDGYRAPSLFERFGTSFFGGFFSPLGNPRLRPERSIAFDGGVDQSFANNKLKMSATYFYTRLQEVVGFDFSGVINPVTDPFGRFFGFLNTGGGLSRGLEVSAVASPNRSTELLLSYTFTNSDQRTAQVTSSGVISSLVIPDHQFSATVTQKIGRRAFVNFDLSVTNAYLAPVFPALFRFNGLVKADVGAAYELPLSDRRRARFFGYVDNIFDRENFESGFQTPGRTARAGASLTF